MKNILIVGIVIVNLALASYSIAIFKQYRSRLMGRGVLVFLTIGLIFDISATVCMIIGSGNFLTLHGVIGYSSLIGMIIDTGFSYRLLFKSGINSPVTPKFMKLSLFAYLYWVSAYITGATIVMLD
ncbi:MAG: hypothetical protein HOO86_03335 [Bacteroidales bacterium]|nr:hypothetical protein [Bacteroidales bacterium]